MASPRREERNLLTGAFMKVRSVWALLWLPLACACSPAGDNGQRGDDVEQGPVDSVVGLKPLPPSLTFHLNYKPEKDWSKCAERDVVVFDMFDSSEADFAKCSELGALTLCYFSSQYEDWRSDSADFGDLGPALDGWEGERWVDADDPKNLEVMRQRLDLAVERGCDGIDLDNVDRDGHEHYVMEIFAEAKARGLYVSQKNAVEKIEKFYDYVDLYQNEQCQEFDECEAYETVGRPVYNIEYSACRSLPYLYSNRKDVEAMDAWEGDCDE